MIVNSGATAPSYAASLQSLMTAAGDIVQASAANTPAALAIGTANQLLRVNAGATAVEWATVAGSQWDRLGTVSSNGSSGTMTLSGLTAKKILMVHITCGSRGSSDIYFRLAGDSAGNYSWKKDDSNTGTATSAASTTQWVVNFAGDTNGWSGWIWVQNAADSQHRRGWWYATEGAENITAAPDFVEGSGKYSGTTQVTQVDAVLSGGNWEAGSEMTVYGGN